MEKFMLTPRPFYVEAILDALTRRDLVFVIGVRRSGKSCVAAQLEQILREEGREKVRVLRINFEKIDSIDETPEELTEQFFSLYSSDLFTYVLLDELSHIRGWEQAVNQIAGEKNTKVILFSSNLRVISEELDAVANDSYELIRMLPLSLEEFIRFQEFREITESETPLAKKRYQRFESGSYTIEDIYNYYIMYGGLPILKPEYMDRERARVIMDGTYSAIVMRDILEYGSLGGSSVITDPVLLRCVITIMAKSIGDNISATWIGKQTAEALGRASSTKTIENYMRALLNAQLFYLAERYDILAEKKLKTLAKYYVVDAGLHNFMTGIRSSDKDRLLENKVFFELLRRGYQVYNGKLGREEITLMAINGSNRIYIQVANDGNMAQMLAALRRIRDNHPKIVISSQEETHTTKDGIHILNALSFLMGASYQS